MVVAAEGAEAMVAAEEVVVETRWGEPLPLAELLDELLQVVAPELH